MADAVVAVVATMQDRLDALTPAQEPLGEFLGTYQRTTWAVGRAVDDRTFEDPVWVDAWDVAFAQLYLGALDAHLAGPTTYDERPAEVEVLSPARIADLLAPGQVLLRLAVAGFGVVLPPAR